MGIRRNTDTSKMAKLKNISQTNNSTIAKNTIYLYFRTFITMAVALYTSRVVLASLGFEDYGIWNVVGGIVAMFLFIKESLSSSIGRFLTFAIGRNNQNEINKAFSTSLIIHLIFALLIVLLCETIGLWFLKDKLVIPEDKKWMAQLVFQISVASTFLSIITVPFHSSLISYERMNVYAYIGLWDAISKLLIAYAISVVDNNRLLIYGLLILASSIFTNGFVVAYVHYAFPKMRYYAVMDKRTYFEVFTFSGWSLFGNIAYMSYTQGVNMIINMFFGPIVNAARAVSLQIEQSVRTFVTNFQAAANPQIIKNCAAGDWNAMHLLIIRSSKFSIYLLFLFALPIVLEVESILTIWLKDVPKYSASFCRIMFGVIFLETMVASIMTGVSANGDIRKYQIVVSSILLTILPLSYGTLSIGMGPESVFFVYFFVEIIACIARIFIAHEKIHLSIHLFINQVVIVTTYVMLLGAIVPIVIHFFMPDSTLKFFLVLTTGFITSCASIYFVGLDAKEKKFLQKKIIYRIISK